MKILCTAVNQNWISDEEYNIISAWLIFSYSLTNSPTDKAIKCMILKNSSFIMYYDNYMCSVTQSLLQTVALLASIYTWASDGKAKEAQLYLVDLFS